MAYSEKFLKFIEIWQNDFAIEASIDKKICCDKAGNPIPWYTYPAIEYLAQFDYHDKSVFEFGCGYSSSFWAKKAHTVTSVEDNATWYERWKTEFNYPNLKILLREEGSPYSDAVLEEKKTYDIIIIDGKCRAECAKQAVKVIHNDGLIILDDSDRVNTSQEYIDAINTLKQHNLLQVDFFGFCPMNNYTKTTSIFFSRNFNFSLLNNVQPINGIGNLWGRKRRERKSFYKENL